MSTLQINSIDEVINELGKIISACDKNNNPLGYFAALYQKVTIKVKEGIESNFFDDGPRMEKLDVIFVKRYIDAYYAWQKSEKVTKSWQKAFEISNNYWPIVLQHLLVGMNAHINLDLGIAAAEVSKNKNIDDLENDFNRINEILSSLVNDVQNNLAEIWPTLKKILQKTNKADDFLVDFSMELARDGAWKFAKTMSATSENQIEKLLKDRDEKITEKAGLVTNPGFVANLIFSIIRLGEKGTVASRIKQLANAGEL
jgi:tetratricopeptide (TPR) repeat protein